MRTALRRFKAWGLALFVINLFLVNSTFGQTTYYSRGTNPNTLTNWNTIRAGGGTSPANFTSGDIFIIQGTGQPGGPYTMTTSGVWTTSGANTHIQVENGATLNVANNTTTQRLTILSGGTVNITANVTLTVNNGNAAGADLSVAGTFIMSGGSSQFVYGASATGDFASGGLFRLARNGGGTGGNIPIATWHANSTVEITGMTNGYPGNMGQTFGNVTFGGTNVNVESMTTNLTCQGNLTLNYTSNGNHFGFTKDALRTITVGGNFLKQGTGQLNGSTGNGNVTVTVAGNFTWEAGAYVGMTSNGTPTITVAGHFSITGGTMTLRNTSSGSTPVLNVAGNFSTSAGTTVTTTSGATSINFNGSGTPQIYTSAGTVSGTLNFTVNSPAFLQMAEAGTQVTGGGTFTVSGTGAGGTLGIRATDGIASTGAAGNIRVTGTRTFTSGANYVYNGSAVQTTGNGLPATVNNLTIDNISGVTLTNNITATTLNLTNGILDGVTNSKITAVASGGSITGGSSTSYVSGKLSQIYTAASSKIFPIGRGVGTYRPLTLNYTALTGTSTITTEQFESGFPGTAPGGTSQVGTRYWNVSRSGGSAFTYTITLNGSGLAFTGSPRIFKHDAGTTLAFTPTVSAPDYTVSGLTTLSDFAFGETTCTGPTITTCASSSSANANASCQAAVPDYTAGTTVGGGCGTVTKTQNPAAGTLVGLGPHTITITATDDNSNTATCNVTFTVNDITAPPVPANDGSTVSCISSATAPTPPTVIDNCSGTITPAGPVTGGTYDGCSGTRTYSWMYNDGSANSAVWTYTYNIVYSGGLLNVPSNGGTTISCPSQATDPGNPGSILDACGRTVVL